MLQVVTPEIEYKHKYGSKVAEPDDVNVLDKGMPEIDQYIHECIEYVSFLALAVLESFEYLFKCALIFPHHKWSFVDSLGVLVD